MIWGGAEGRSGLYARLWDDLAIPDKEQSVVEGADHLYVGFESEVARVVDDFLK